MLSRGLVRRSGKVLVPATTAPTFGDNQPLVRMLEVMHQLARVLVIDEGSNRHLQDDVFTLGTCAIRTFSVASALCFVLWIEPKMHQRIVLLAGFHDHVATATAISTRRTSARHALLAPEGHAAIPATTSPYSNFRFSNKHKGGRRTLRH